MYQDRKINQLYEQIEAIKTYDSSDSLTVQVTNQKTFKDILNLAKKYKILTIDAEWVQPGGSVDIALLQISFPNGQCFLIDHHQKLPNEFLVMLEKSDILKIGIGILDEDVRRFKSQWKIQPKGLVDIRHLVVKFYPDLKKLGMKSLATNILDVTLDKHWHVAGSNWEAETLNQRQIKYAANDVLIVMAILLKIVADKHCSSVQDFQDLLRTAYDLCSQYTDVPYKDKAPK